MADSGEMLLSRARRNGLRRTCALRSLQFKASFLVAMLILLVTVGGMSLSLAATRKALFDSESHRTREWAHSLAMSQAADVAIGDIEALQQAAQILVRAHAVAYIAYIDSEGRLLAAAESTPGLLSRLLTDNGAELRAKLRSEPSLARSGTGPLTWMEVAVPVVVRTQHSGVAADPTSPVGHLYFAADVSDTQAKLRDISSELVRIAVGVILLVIPGSLLATRRMVAPLHELARTAETIANGNRDARAPVRSGDEIGQLAGAFNRMADCLTQSQIELLELNAQLEARVAQRTRDLEEQAARDPLTGLYNRRHFGEVITREFATAARYNHDLTCLMFDVDHFKEINDRYGHRTGDRILIALAQALMFELRGSDVAARFGGDEFILLLPQTPAQQASALAERIVNRFSEDIADEFPGMTTTLSIGVASLQTTRARSSEALIHEADVALYAAKEGGRNRTMQAVGAV